jgi:NAD-dependent dihydropyrimidine dehydrogenase PreA subunit
MARQRLTVVLSQAQGKHPVKQALEESIVAALLMEQGLDVSVVPYLYDIHDEHTARLFLESVTGDMVVLSWIFPRAAFWVLDRDGIKGHWGESLLKPDEDEEEEEEEEKPSGIGSVDVPDRYLYCVDLRNSKNYQDFVDEVLRIAAECRQRSAAAPQGNGTATLVNLGLNLLSEPATNGHAQPATNGHAQPHFPAQELLQPPDRRWYPVIDYSRCTNCMECIDFCLFGVYGLDNQDRILVENQDQCRKGCPACSRVCPEQAIIFPNHKTPAIAGAPVGAISGLKIDLSKLFGGDTGKDALSQAVDERDRELVADGRDAVGASVGLPKRQSDQPAQPRDDLDNLMDSLDDLDI